MPSIRSCLHPGRQRVAAATASLHTYILILRNGTNDTWPSLNTNYLITVRFLTPNIDRCCILHSLVWKSFDKINCLSFMNHMSECIDIIQHIPTEENKIPSEKNNRTSYVSLCHISLMRLIVFFCTSFCLSFVLRRILVYIYFEQIVPRSLNYDGQSISRCNLRLIVSYHKFNKHMHNLGLSVNLVDSVTTHHTITSNFHLIIGQRITRHFIARQLITWCVIK